MCLKRLITAPFERSEPFHLLRLMGMSVPSLHIESTDSMITAPFGSLDVFVCQRLMGVNGCISAICTYRDTTTFFNPDFIL